jgi:osmoprotectant transport system permease protein
MVNSVAILAPLAQFGPNSGFFKDRSNPDCVQSNGAFCFDWARDNIDRWGTPTLEHLALVSISVALGFSIALFLAVISHQRRWLETPIVGVTGVLYTIPSIAFFLLLLPLTGRGTDTAVIALTAYTLQILYRNIITGLANVPAASKDAGLGMGMTSNQLLWRVELPLAIPEIIAGLRIATVSTVAIATLAVFAGAGGLGAEIYPENITFKTGVIITGLIAILMALLFDLVFLLLQRFIVPWRTARMATA